MLLNKEAIESFHFHLSTCTSLSSLDECERVLSAIEQKSR